MTEKEAMIIEMMKESPACEEYGGYKYLNHLFRIIARVMGYNERMFINGKWCHGKNVNKERHNVMVIVHGMENKGIIRVSKNKTMYKELI